MTNEIPEKRDFEVKNIALENDLVPLSVTVTGDFVVPIYWKILETGNGSGLVHFWNSPTKSKEYKLGEGNEQSGIPPQVIWLEGVEPSSTLRDISVQLEFQYSTLYNGNPITRSEPLKLTVTPVTQQFEIFTGNVDWLIVEGRKLGLKTHLGSANNAGDSSEATVDRTGIKGNSFFIQNVTSVTNGGDTSMHLCLDPTVNMKTQILRFYRIFLDRIPVTRSSIEIRTKTTTYRTIYLWRC